MVLETYGSRHSNSRRQKRDRFRRCSEWPVYAKCKRNNSASIHGFHRTACVEGMPGWAISPPGYSTVRAEGLREPIQTRSLPATLVHWIFLFTHCKVACGLPLSKANRGCKISSWFWMYNNARQRSHSFSIVYAFHLINHTGRFMP